MHPCIILKLKKVCIKQQQSLFHYHQKISKYALSTTTKEPICMNLGIQS